MELFFFAVYISRHVPPEKSKCIYMTTKTTITAVLGFLWYNTIKGELKAFFLYKLRNDPPGKKNVSVQMRT